MERTPRVGLYAPRLSKGTGPATYLAALGRALPEGSVFPLSGPGSAAVDVVHVVDAKRLSLSELSAFGAPVIADFHDHYWCAPPSYPSPDRFFRRLRQTRLYRHHLMVFEGSRALVVHSRAVEAAVAAVMEREKLRRPLFVVPCALPPDSAGTFSENQPPPPPAVPLLLMVGRDMFRKGLAVALEALPLVLSDFPSARLVVIGDEYPHTRLFGRLLARGLPAAFLPGRPPSALREWYGRASVLILPSYEEAFGIVLLEAMAADLPVVASRTGGIPEVVEDNLSGLLHAPGDARDLAQKVLAVLRDEHLRNRLILAGRQRVSAFSTAALAANLARIYRAVLEEK